MRNLRVHWENMKKHFKKAECPVEGYHAHKYVDSFGHVRYLPMEVLSYQGYQRTDEYVMLKEEKEEQTKRH